MQRCYQLDVQNLHGKERMIIILSIYLCFGNMVITNLSVDCIQIKRLKNYHWEMLSNLHRSFFSFLFWIAKRKCIIDSRDDLTLIELKKEEGNCNE